MDIVMEAIQSFENNQPDKAIELINKNYSNMTVNEKADIAEVYSQWGFLEEAISVLKELVRIHPNDSTLKVMLADVYIENNNDEEALILLNDIQENDDAYLQSLVQQADLYQAQGLFEVAEQKLLTAKRLAPEEEIIDFALGELLFSTGDYVKAINFYEKIKSPEIAGIVISERLAESYATTGQYEKALDYYKQIDNDHPDTLFKYGYTAAQTDRKDIAINTWEKVIEKDPYYHTVYAELAKLYEEDGLIEEAYDTVLKGKEIDAFNKEIYLLAGQLAHKLNKNDESKNWISEAIALDQDYKEAILFNIELLKEDEDYTKIVEFLNYIQSEGADDPLYDWELARAHENLESYNEALKHYNQAYNNLNNDSDFLKEYGYFLMEEGRIEDSIKIFETYLKLLPEDFEIAELIQRFK